jgi:hypothetical protein
LSTNCKLNAAEIYHDLLILAADRIVVTDSAGTLVAQRIVSPLFSLFFFCPTHTSYKVFVFQLRATRV